MEVIAIVMVVVSGEALFVIARDSRLVRLPDPWKRDSHAPLWPFVYLVLLVLIEPPNLSPQSFRSGPWLWLRKSNFTLHQVKGLGPSLGLV